MYQKEQYSSLVYNPNRERPQRPQTPIASSNQQSFTQYNRSFSKNNISSYSPYKYSLPNNYPRQQNPNIEKSRVSVSSSHSQLSFLNADQGEVFPEDLVFLLKNEEKNIHTFKDKIEKEKARVENDFTVLKTELEHTLEDLKLSVQAQLDLVYKVFISKYAEIKGQVQEIRRLRKQILMANQIGLPQSAKGKDSSNNDIISEIEKDAQHFRHFRVYGYLSEMQKQKLNPILELCNELILIGSIDTPFYRSKQMNQKHKEIKNNFSSNLGQVFTKLTDYVITPAAIIQKEKQQEQNSANILKNLEQDNLRQPFDAIYSDNRGQEFGRRKPSPHHFQSWEDKPSESSGKKIPIIKVSNSQKCLVTKWAESTNLKKLQRVVTDHSETILCIFFIDNRYIATGSKDKTINIYTFDGQKVTTLKGHDASICSLSSIHNRNQTFLASGGDHGCSCLILWDTKTWTIASRIQSHSAAVTSIVDLQDNQHLVTGSYDKKINLYNYAKRQVISSYSNKSAVTSIVLTSDKKKLISAGLDKQLYVWNISQRNNILTLEIGRSISNNQIICVLESSLLRPQIVYGASRDGKIKIFNINSENSLEKVLTANENSILELVAIQRQMKTDGPMILTCSSKDKSLRLTKMDNGITQDVKVNGACNIQFGCGIGPKIIVSPNGIMAILSQSSTAKQFSLFEVELK